MIPDELTDEEKAILAFLETYFEKHDMSGTLAIVRDSETKVDDLREVIAVYRWLYQSER